MKLAMVRTGAAEEAAIITDTMAITFGNISGKLGKGWHNDIFAIIESGQLAEIRRWYQSGGLTGSDFGGMELSEVSFVPPYRSPNKIWCIGLNYREHARDLEAAVPNLHPTCFMKPGTTIIGHGDDIVIPSVSTKTTAEAELGVVIGKKCKDVKRESWLDVVAGFVNVIDMTEEDIVRHNPRYVTYAKCFDTFFSFGPCLVTADEIESISSLAVSTVKNGQKHASNLVLNMSFPPDYLVSFYSQAMTLLPGDIISTGTPRAVAITGGDTVECRITGFPTLANPVVNQGC
ncbi:fumarylacetoacetate hydrolase family protein [Chloroflexota bacterium]